MQTLVADGIKMGSASKKSALFSSHVHFRDQSRPEERLADRELPTR
jgi:hypothetical protein